MPMQKLLDDLRKERPIFHLEDDFQQSVVDKMSASGFSSVRREATEYAHLLGDMTRVDIMSDEAAVELKYPTAPFKCECAGTQYDFAKNNSKNSVLNGRYRFWKDVWRLEQLVFAGDVVKTGYAILLTNRHKYWTETRDDWLSNFNLSDGKEVSEKLSIREECKCRDNGETRKWKRVLPLAGKYKIQWQDWSHFENKENGRFRYLCLKIGG